jgi:hypothetical protein
LPRLFDIFSTPSSPSSSGVVITICVETEGRHDVAADVQVEQLIGAPELDVGLQRHRVVRLRQRVEKLVDRDRLAVSKRCRNSRRSIICATLYFAASFDPGHRCQWHEPAAVELDDGLLAVEQLEHLGLVGFGVALDLTAVSAGASSIVPWDRRSSR